MPELSSLSNEGWPGRFSAGFSGGMAAGSADERVGGGPSLGGERQTAWRVLEHYVMEAHAAKDWSQVRRLIIDETSARKGHRYVTVVLDAESHDLWPSSS